MQVFKARRAKDGEKVIKLPDSATAEYYSVLPQVNGSIVLIPINEEAMSTAEKSAAVKTPKTKKE